MPEKSFGLHVLFVADDPESSEPLRAALEQAGALVSVAPSHDGAVNALEAIRPDVLLADMGGGEEEPARLITRVRALPRCAEMPAIVVTADGRRDARERLLEAGYQRHLRRPVDAKRLRRLIASLAQRHE